MGSRPAPFKDSECFTEFAMNYYGSNTGELYTGSRVNMVGLFRRIIDEETNFLVYE